ncbi:GerAB/ArcD/ProY family transporter [Aquibacillus sediminis]|uniref:GerAB/ArcD/ProY family transporter n=1 Tax=Aquibacillus sediminis TaxID=2574734 RepID=UPI0014862548|nr:endospore germination permease [Aquibacillus sediminis]
MLHQEKISVRQFTILVFMYTLGTSVIYLPSLVASYGKENGWISVLGSSLIGFGVVFILNKIAQLDEKKHLFELLEFIFGKWIGRIISVLILMFVIYLLATNLRQIGDFITTQVMVQTPIYVIMIIFILVSLFAVKLGLEVIGRTSEIFFPYALFSLILLIVLVAPQADFSNIQPLFRENIAGAFLAVFPASEVPYFQLFVFLAIFPSVNKPDKAKKGFYIGVALGSFILFIITFMALMVLGPDFTARNQYPTYILGKKISIAEFIERIEILVAIAWFFSIFFKLTINFYALSLGVSYLLKLKSVQTLTTPIAFFVVILGIILFPNIIYFMDFSQFYWPFFAITFGLFIPLLMLLIGMIKKRKQGNGSQTPS